MHRLFGGTFHRLHEFVSALADAAERASVPLPAWKLHALKPTMSRPDSLTEITASRPAAVLPRRGQRAHRDLFAPQPEPEGIVRETPPVMPVAARHENSVLFSVAELKEAEERAASIAPPPEVDHSNIIDLNKLTGEHELSSHSIQPVVLQQSAFNAPITFAPPEIDTEASFEDAMPKRGNRWGVPILAFVGTLAVGLIGLAVSGVFQSAPVQAPAAALVAAPPPVVEAPVPAKEPTPALSTPAPEEPVAIASSGNTSKHRLPPKGHRTTKSHRAPAVGAASAPAAPKRADPCNCRGNLQCAIRCTL